MEQTKVYDRFPMWIVVLSNFVGVLIYLIVHGGDMQDRSARDAIVADPRRWQATRESA